MGWLIKANFDPNQPHVPAGNPDSGQWTDGGSSATDFSAGRRRPPPNLGDPPRVPPEKPPSKSERLAIAKAIVAAVANERRVRLIVRGILWFKEYIPYVTAYFDGPRTLEELQSGVGAARIGYEDHHIVEQTPARKEGFPHDLIEARDNKVSISYFKHRAISDWYSTKNKDLGMQTPRDYLRGKSWEERRAFGLNVLVEHGVLKP